ncbi:ribbon-helix-helix protein, CopG family [Jidongwangia harbinensis]|uniref:ribbon-helix-helix protein, CopG family n=1 Tax=Jidongwangia harbinensis TaxID=2878561 RepID=UPI001CD9BAD2|nr:ribbon-helix-helix domain-containing protein [Jidongwangia harbinensis]
MAPFSLRKRRPRCSLRQKRATSRRSSYRARPPVRPSLSTGGGTSHRINVRVEDEIYDVLQRVARDSGRRPSELVREVLRAAYGPKS